MEEMCQICATSPPQQGWTDGAVAIEDTIDRWCKGHLRELDVPMSWTADHWCIQCHVVDMTFETPTIHFQKCAKPRALRCHLSGLRCLDHFPLPFV